MHATQPKFKACWKILVYTFASFHRRPGVISVVHSRYSVWHSRAADQLPRISLSTLHICVVLGQFIYPRTRFPQSPRTAPDGVLPLAWPSRGHSHNTRSSSPQSPPDGAAGGSGPIWYSSSSHRHTSFVGTSARGSIWRSARTIFGTSFQHPRDSPVFRCRFCWIVVFWSC